MNGVVEGSDLNTSRFLGGSQTNVVGTQQDVEEDGTFGAICTLNSAISIRETEVFNSFYIKRNLNLRATVRTHSLEIREPPQKYLSSMNKATYGTFLYKRFKFNNNELELNDLIIFSIYHGRELGAA